MKPEQQRIAIAEACPDLWKINGWKWTHSGYLANPELMRSVDPLTDLNAMHEAERYLLSHNDWSARAYQVMLQNQVMVTKSWTWHATAAQRAEALLRTLNLWEE